VRWWRKAATDGVVSWDFFAGAGDCYTRHDAETVAPWRGHGEMLAAISARPLYKANNRLKQSIFKEERRKGQIWEELS